MQNKRIVLIGGAGTLGSDILNMELENCELFVIDDFTESVLTEEEVKHKCNYKNMSIADELTMTKFFQDFKPDLVLYLATTISKNEWRNFESNVLGMANTIKAAEKTNFPRLVYFQSFLTRKSDSIINASSTFDVKDSYSIWKLAAELLLKNYAGEKTTVILASVLSPKLSVGAIPAFLDLLNNNKKIIVTETHRDYIDIKTFISGINSIIQQKNPPEILVLGSGAPISTLEILKSIALKCQKDLSKIDFAVIQPKSSDPKYVCLDNDWFKSLNSTPMDIKTCIETIVDNLNLSKIKSRQHHFYTL
jgi:nucleoside-diphosphate-sugar epimerase